MVEKGGAAVVEQSRAADVLKPCLLARPVHARTHERASSRMSDRAKKMKKLRPDHDTQRCRAPLHTQTHAFYRRTHTATPRTRSPSAISSRRIALQRKSLLTGTNSDL